jgi:hypothetical protein
MFNSNECFIFEVQNALMSVPSPLSRVGILSQRRIKREDCSPTFDLEEGGFVVKPTSVGIGSGYAVSAGRDEKDEPVIDIKTYGKVDMSTVQRELKSLFPNVRIRHVNQASPVTLIKKVKRKRKLHR